MLLNGMRQNSPHIGVYGATGKDGAARFWNPFLNILQDLLVDLLVGPGGVEARLCQTRFAMLVNTPFVHSIILYQRSLLLSLQLSPECALPQRGHSSLPTHPSRTALSVLMIYSIPSSTCSNCPFVMITAISNMTSVSLFSPVISQST